MEVRRIKLESFAKLIARSVAVAGLEQRVGQVFMDIGAIG